MIGFMPKIYEDELCYSWFARYYCHSGYSAYGYALDDLFGKRTIHFSAGYINVSFQEDARKIITDIIPMEKMILKHTLFPIVRFMDHQRMQKALECMVRQEGKVGDLLPLPKSKAPRYLRYCPICAKEQREKFGEAFWTRTANIHNLDICAKHRCRLKDTAILLSGKQSPRLYIAEQEIEDMEPEFVNDGLELQFASYLTKVFQAPINTNNDIHISDYLNSKLEGTKYLNVTGVQRNIGLLFNDIKEHYKNMQNKIELSQMKKIFNGYSSNFYEVCQIAYVLGIDAEELTAPTLPEKSQKERFNEQVESLRKEGCSDKKIARILGADSHSVGRVGATKEKADHDYSVRKGMHKEDWNKMDKEMLPMVKDACKNLYISKDGVPGKVSVATIERILKIPGKRIAYLPKCRKEIQKYEEPQEVFWARKIVWNYRKLVSENQIISYNKLCRPLNLRRANFISSFPFLSLFCEEKEEKRIKGLI